MTSSLAVVLERSEDCATVAQPLSDLPTFVDDCTNLDGEELGEYVERNWPQVLGNALGLMHLAKEMKRKFKLLDRKKQVDGTYLTIRGFKSFDKWVTSFTGVSRRKFYYLLETEEKKNERNANRHTNGKKKNDTGYATFAARCEATKKTLAEIQRQVEKPFNNRKSDETRDWDALYGQLNPAINEVFNEFLALISPEGYEVLQADKGWTMTKKDEDEPEPPSPDEDKKARRGAAAKKAMATRAANKAAAQPAAPADSLGECELCCDGALATQVVGVTEWNSDGYKYCAKCADLHGKDDRKYLIRQMSVQKVVGKFCTLETLAKLGGKPMDFGDGDVCTYPTVADYIAILKERFLGNESYDQTVVVEHIARLEKKMEAL
jgi:hypothetical protein